MKKIITTCIFASAVFAAGTAKADTACYPGDPCYGQPAAYQPSQRYYPSTPHDKIHNYSLSPEISKYSYKEPGVMEDTGTFYGISGEYVNRGLVTSGQFSTYLAGQVRYMRSGDVDYEGRTWGGTPVSVYGISQYYMEARALAGLTMDVMHGLKITPYTGLGIRYLIDKNNEVSSGGYRRQSAYLYMPVGLIADFDLRGGWQLSVTGEYDHLVKGRQKSRIGEGTPEFFWETPNMQNEGFGLRLDIKAERQINPGVSFFVQPFIRYWKIKDSDLSYSGYTDPVDGVIYVFEPENRTTEYGLKFGLTF